MQCYCLFVSLLTGTGMESESIPVCCGGRFPVCHPTAASGVLAFSYVVIFEVSLHFLFKFIALSVMSLLLFGHHHCLSVWMVLFPSIYKIIKEKFV